MPRNKNNKRDTDRYIIPRARYQELSPSYWNHILQTSLEVKKNYGTTLTREYILYYKGNLNYVIPKHDWNKTGLYIANKIINQAGYFESLQIKTRVAKKKILTFLRQIKNEKFSNLNQKGLLSKADEIFKLFIQYDAASLFAWYVAGDKIKKLSLKMLGWPEGELDQVTLPKQQTFTSLMNEEMLAASLTKQPIGKLAERLTKKYYWIPFGYNGPKIWGKGYFIQQLQNLRKNNQATRLKYSETLKQNALNIKNKRKILAKKGISKLHKRLIYILQTLAIWTDERKMLEFQLFYHYRRILTELGKRYRIGINKLFFILTEELGVLETNAAKLNRLASQRQKKKFMLISEGSRAWFSTDVEYRKMIKSLAQQFQNKIITGQVASHGPKNIYAAIVKVLKTPREINKIKPEELLITAMTTPEYMPAMNRALGFITDEGGITCHAAIVAREMNKPCIIGTKNATQTLKDGDKVMVDTNQGTVKIIP